MGFDPNTTSLRLSLISPILTGRHHPSDQRLGELSVFDPSQQSHADLAKLRELAFARHSIQPWQWDPVRPKAAERTIQPATRNFFAKSLDQV